MKIDEIKKAYIQGKHVPPAMAGEAIAKDAQMFFSYLMDNNPEAINNTLKVKLGFTSLPFAPDRKAMGGVIHMLIAKNDTAKLQQVINGFNEYGGFNEKAGNYTVDAQLRTEILKHL